MFDDNIIKFVRKEHGIIICESTAEKIKEELGSAFETNVISWNKPIH
jgi:rod shape-determining protein MreB